jgi:hypothetical protein
MGSNLQMTPHGVANDQSDATKMIQVRMVVAKRHGFRPMPQESAPFRHRHADYADMIKDDDYGTGTSGGVRLLFFITPSKSSPKRPQERYYWDRATTEKR